MEWALVGLVALMGVLWALDSARKDSRVLSLEIRLAESISQKTLTGILDRTLASNPREQAGRLKATRREGPRPGLTPVDEMYAEKETSEPEPFKRVQPRSHAHIPELAGYDVIRVMKDCVKCYPPPDGSTPLSRIPLEYYWSLVEQYSGQSA